MADDAQVDQEQIERDARAMGWLPKEEFEQKHRGSAEGWADAAAFVERGRQVMPILQENNKRLLTQLHGLNSKVQSLESVVRASEAAVEALEASHAKDVEEQVKAAREGLVRELEVASRDGDHASVAQLTAKLTELNTANLDAGGEDKGGKGKGGNGEDRAPVIPPEVVADIKGWFERNPDYRAGKKNRLAQVVMQEFRDKGDTRVGSVFLDAVAAEVEDTFGEEGRPGKAAGDTGGRGRSTGSGGGGGAQKTYADLPPEAKAACDKMNARLVGANRAHKDIASWRASYVKQYFGEGS